MHARRSRRRRSVPSNRVFTGSALREELHALVFSPDDWRARIPQDGYDGVIYALSAIAQQEDPGIVLPSMFH